jgi:hypothetical protein
MFESSVMTVSFTLLYVLLIILTILEMVFYNMRKLTPHLYLIFNIVKTTTSSATWIVAILLPWIIAGIHGHEGPQWIASAFFIFVMIWFLE